MDSDSRQSRIVELGPTPGRVEVAAQAGGHDVATVTQRPAMKQLAGPRRQKPVHGGAGTLETAAVDITVNTICPSYVKTPLVEQQIADQARIRHMPESEVMSKVMLEPMPKAVFIGFDELAGITAFLMSPAARNITGQMIVVDGGWTAR